MRAPRSTSAWYKLASVCLILIFFVQVQEARAAGKFIQTQLIYYGGGPKLTSSDVSALAKFDILNVDRWRYNQITSNTWATIKATNPNSQIYLYEMGPEVANDQDAMAALWLNNLGRYNISRGNSAGSLNGNNPGLFQLDASNNRIYNTGYPNMYLLDFGSTTYQTYWINSVYTDIISQPWVADGIFADNCEAISNSYSGTSATYPSDTAWANAMNSFTEAIAAGMHGYNQKLGCNKGETRTTTGSAAWLALDANANHPDLLMEEGTFAVSWGTSDTQFYSESEWKRQIDTEAAMQNSKVVMLSHTNLPEGGSGTDNYGKPVTYWQTLWYSIASFLIGKNDIANNDYFMFSNSIYGYNKIWWYSEYDDIDLGKAISPYTMSVINGTDIYWREFEKGYVVVNPTVNNVTGFTLPQTTKQLTHDNLTVSQDTLNAIPAGLGIALGGHTGSIFLKATMTFSNNGNISLSDKYAWGNYAGWVNFAPVNSVVTVTDTTLTGSAWSVSDGWLNLNPSQGGVQNDGAGHLSGFAWDESAGWVSFLGVTIDASGVFHGQATGANGYAINFDCSTCKVITTWRPVSSQQTTNTTSPGAISPIIITTPPQTQTQDQQTTPATQPTSPTPARSPSPASAPANSSTGGALVPSPGYLGGSISSTSPFAVPPAQATSTAKSRSHASTTAAATTPSSSNFAPLLAAGIVFLILFFVLRVMRWL